jgi:hypothetical protein
VGERFGGGIGVERWAGEEVMEPGEAGFHGEGTI